MLPVVAPMLATQGIPGDGLDLYAAEPKLDSWRVAVGVEPGAVTLRTRRARDITDQLPELQPLRELDLHVVLDGELIANAGRAGDFYRVAPAVASRRRGVAASRRRESITFVAFDVLWLDDEFVMDETYDGTVAFRPRLCREARVAR
jgi:ATP-dependent DNA ligase